MRFMVLLVVLSRLLAGCSGGDGGASLVIAAPEPLWTNSSLVETADGPVQGLATAQDTWAWKAIPWPASIHRFSCPPWTRPLA